MKKICTVPRVGTQFLFGSFLLALVLGGCVTVNCPPGGKGEELPCATTGVPKGDPSCANGGVRCAQVNAVCTKQTGGFGHCQNDTTGGTCSCLCL